MIGSRRPARPAPCSREVGLGRFRLGGFRLGWAQHFAYGDGESHFPLLSVTASKQRGTCLAPCSREVRLGGIRLGGFRLGGFRLGGFRLGRFRLGGFRLGGFRLGGIRLGGFRLGWAQHLAHGDLFLHHLIQNQGALPARDERAPRRLLGARLRHGRYLVSGVRYCQLRRGISAPHEGCSAQGYGTVVI